MIWESRRTNPCYSCCCLLKLLAELYFILSSCVRETQRSLSLYTVAATSYATNSTGISYSVCAAKAFIGIITHTEGKSLELRKCLTLWDWKRKCDS
jgi:hypothetical protein